MIHTNMNKYIPSGSSPGLTRAPGQPLGGTYIGCSVLHNLPACPTFSVYRCNRRRFATCAVIKPFRFFRSSLTNRRYPVISTCESLVPPLMLYILSAALNAISSTLAKQNKRSVRDYLVIALVSRNTQTLSSLGISTCPDILWMTSEYNLLNISHRTLERPRRILPLDA